MRNPVLILLFLITLAACSDVRDDLSMYEYRDTRDLVRFVQNAAERIRNEGLSALKEYRDPSKLTGNYIYLYDMNGVNIFHSGMPDLENKPLRNITDKDGKRAIEHVLMALENPRNPHGWVHYTWWEPGKFYPVPKSSCHFKVTLPDGRKCFVGGGLNYPLEEEEFARIAVDSAVDLIAAKGLPALAEISDAKSPFNFREVTVFAFRPDGEIVVSPVLGDSLYNVNLLTCVDEVGNKPFVTALKHLKRKNTVWQAFMAKNRFERQPVKKMLYLARATLEGEPLLVGAVTDLPQAP